jgi:hypothetical protein
VIFELRVQAGDWNDFAPRAQQRFVAQIVEALAQLNTSWLLKGDRWKHTPLLYESGVRFRREDDAAIARGENLWQNLPIVLDQGFGHCIGLTAWRLAELRVRYHELALPCVQIFEEVRPVVGRLQEFHVSVLRVNDAHEDPSWQLGMR